MRDTDANARDLIEHIYAMTRRLRLVDRNAVASPHQLNRQELYVIEYLGSGGPCIISELARYLMVAVNTVTHVVDSLESKGFVRRERSTVNRRKVWVHLTTEGQRRYENQLTAHLPIAKTLLSSLNSDEQHIFLVLLRKLEHAAPLKAKRDEAEAG